MSGHSKWSKVKHQKETTDAQKGQAFTKAAMAIAVAVREGGGITDPEKNFRLRLAIEKARAVNMPKENIARAIERAGGAGAGAFEMVTYEAYGPAGVALMIEAATDNRQRTVAEIKNVLERLGGNLASPGAVSYLFERLGVMLIPKIGLTFDRLLEQAINVGARDIQETSEVFEVYTESDKLTSTRKALEKQGIVASSSEIVMRPKAGVELLADQQVKVDSLIAELGELTDVQNVFTNVA